MKIGKRAGAFLVAFFLLQNIIAQSGSPVDLVNPLMGTDTKPSLSNGNTYPFSNASTTMNELSDLGKLKRNIAALSVGVSSADTPASARYTL